MSLIIRHRLPTADEFCAMRRETGWGTLLCDQARNAQGASLCGAVLKDGPDCIGMVRVVGDGVLNLYVQDMIIAKDYRGKGYGRLLLSGLIDRLKQDYPASCDVGLMAAKGQAGFYESFGFRARPCPSTDAGMLSALSKLTPSQKRRD